MNTILVLIIVASVVFSVVSGRIDEMSNAVLSGSGEAVSLVIKIAGGLCFWSGIMNLIKKTGISDFISRVISPFIKLVFPKLNLKSDAAKYISMNVTANLLGLGNAATPLGLKAMSELQKMNNNKKVASDYMVTFVVINSASIQLIPTTLSVLRSSFGSKNPMDILPCVLICSVVSLSLGVLVSKIIPIINRRKYK